MIVLRIQRPRLIHDLNVEMSPEPENNTWESRTATAAEVFAIQKDSLDQNSHLKS